MKKKNTEVQTHLCDICFQSFSILVRWVQPPKNSGVFDKLMLTFLCSHFAKLTSYSCHLKKFKVFHPWPASVAGWLEHSPIHQKVAGASSTLCQDTEPGCGLDPMLKAMD